MRPTLELAIADEEVVLDVAHHPFILALRLRPGRTTGLRDEAVVTGQIEKPWMEPDEAATRMLEYRRLLIVHQDLARHTAEPLKAPDESFIGVRGVFAVRAPKMKPPGEPQRVDEEVTVVSAPAIRVRCSPQSLCNCRPGAVSNRTVARRIRNVRFGRM